MGDVEALLSKQKKRSIYMAVCAGRNDEKQGSINMLVVRLALDANILQIPVPDPEIPNLNLYYRGLPTKAVLYAMRGSVLANYGIAQLREDWKSLFAENPLYAGLSQRYETPRQALTEFHYSENSPIVPALQHKLYGRVTAYSHECVLRAIYGAALSKSFPDAFEGIPKMIVLKPSKK